MKLEVSHGIVVLLALLAAGCGSESSDTVVRPNVVVIVLDTTRADVFGCYGHGGALTPRIDALAKEGVRYTRAYATDFWTLPSHASLLTGLYPTQCQATSETNHLPAAVTTLAERLKAEGYRTGAAVANAWVSAERGFAQGFDVYHEGWRQRARGPVAAERAVATRAAAWFLENAGETADEPSFLFVNLNIAHLPYRPRPSVFERVRSREWPPDQVRRVSEVHGMWAHLAGQLKLGETDLRVLRELYEAEIAHADELVGLVLDAIDRSGTRDRTLVVLTSDHGENLGDHGMIDHLLSMYETTIRIPLIVRYPERFAGGRAIDHLVSLVDIVPTVLDVCGLPAEESSGIPRLGVPLDSGSLPDRPFVVAENDRPVNGVNLLRQHFPRFDVTAIDRPVRTLITPTHKLIWHVGGETELYDLAADPEELENLSQTQGELRASMLATIRRWTETSLRGVKRAEPLESRDAQALERLRGLTYVK
jgi:arylsulfatase A-like enzyme